MLPENFGVPLEGDRDVGALCDEEDKKKVLSMIEDKLNEIRNL